MIGIRPFDDADWPEVWQILEPTLAAGDTYAIPADVGDAAMRHAWVDQADATFVACTGTGEVVGSYLIRPNQPGRGGHVCNCSFAVAASARRRGIATAMSQHSQIQARKMGFTAIQFNLVVSTNLPAMALWQKLGFSIVGTLPRAFDHKALGLVDAHVMFKTLAPV